MNRARRDTRIGGFTLIEMLCVVAIMAILASMLLPALSQAKGRAKRVACVNNLRQTGYGFHIFANDHEGRFPMQVPMREGGSMEYTQSVGQATSDPHLTYLHFQALAAELTTPRILICSADTRWPAETYPILTNDNVSYFINLRAENGRSTSILAGDRNLTNDWVTGGNVFELNANSYLRWTRELHRYRGNILYGDAHVEGLNGAILVVSAQDPPSATLEFPDPPGPPTAGRPGTGGPGISVPNPLGRVPTPVARAQASTKVAAPPGSSGPGSQPSPPPLAAHNIATTVAHSNGVAVAIDSTGKTNSVSKTNRPPRVAVFGQSQEPAMGVFDVQLVEFVQDLMKWTYLFLLLLLLLYAAFRAWIWYRGRNTRKDGRTKPLFPWMRRGSKERT